VDPNNVVLWLWAHRVIAWLLAGCLCRDSSVTCCGAVCSRLRHDFSAADAVLRSQGLLLLSSSALLGGGSAGTS
jgi:hypothetical protein